MGLQRSEVQILSPRPFNCLEVNDLRLVSERRSDGARWAIHLFELREPRWWQRGGRFRPAIVDRLGGANRVAKFLSNVASRELADPVYDRQPVPPWDLGDDDTLLLTNLQVVDVDRGKLADQRHVVVRGRRIAGLLMNDELAAARSRLQAKREIDCAGHYLIPGLSDVHCHISQVSEFGVGLKQIRYLDSQRLRNSEETLKRGCTFVRDCGAAVAPVAFIRSEIEACRLLGPRIMTSTNAMSPRGGMWDIGRIMNKLAEPMFGGRVLRFPNGSAEIVRAMAEINSYGCDFFKTYFEERPLYGGKESSVYTKFTPAEARVIRETADGYGKRVSAHTMFVRGSRLIGAAPQIPNPGGRRVSAFITRVRCETPSVIRSSPRTAAMWPTPLAR